MKCFEKSSSVRPSGGGGVPDSRIKVRVPLISLSFSQTKACVQRSILIVSENNGRKMTIAALLSSLL
jgi:hypothetical protein